MSELTGRRVLVTGGATGIGAAITTALLNDGASVAVVQRTDEELDQALVSSALQGQVTAIAADLSRADGCRDALAQARERLGGLDGLVNNAAWTGPVVRRAVADMDDEYIDQVVDLNLKGVLRCSRAAAAVMGRGGVIVSIASVLAQVPQPQSALYAATKAGVMALTKGLAIELGQRGIRAVTVSPGDIATDSSVPLTQQQVGAGRPGRSSVLGRRGAADEVAAVVAFLLSDGASYITGTDVLVDGGYFLS